MTEDRYLEIIECYGVDPKRWPKSERVQALVFAKTHPAIANKPGQPEQALDDILNTGALDSADNRLLTERILKIALKTPQEPREYSLHANDFPSPETKWASLTLPLSLPWKSLAATLLLTIGMGFAVGQVAETSSSLAEAEALLASSTGAFDRFSALGDTE